MNEQIAKMEEILALLDKRQEWLNSELKYVKDKRKKVKWMLNNLNQIELDLNEVRKYGESAKDSEWKPDQV